MFLGVSKNIGNGFRVGVGTKLGREKATSKEFNTKEFQEFIQKVENDLNESLIVVIEANGYDYNNLLKNEDIKKELQSNEKFNKFNQIANEVNLNIEKILYSGDNGIVAKRKITDELFKIKEFMLENYPNITPKHKIKKKNNIFVKALKLIGKIFLFLLLLGFILSLLDKNDKDSPQIQQQVKLKD